MVKRVTPWFEPHPRGFGPLNWQARLALAAWFITCAGAFAFAVQQRSAILAYAAFVVPTIPLLILVYAKKRR